MQDQEERAGGREGREYIKDTASEDAKHPERKQVGTVEKSSRTSRQSAHVGRDAGEGGAVVVVGAPPGQPGIVPQQWRQTEATESMKRKKRRAVSACVDRWSTTAPHITGPQRRERARASANARESAIASADAVTKE